jgi:uncharacterized protein (DUF433 family)
MGDVAADIVYAGRDPRSIPAYTVAEAARCVRVPSATLRSWTVGRHYKTQEGKKFFPPLITPADSKGVVLSFWNLIEAHVLRAFRTQHGVAIPQVRSALQFAEKRLGIDRLLLNKELSASGGELFLSQYGQLVNLSRAGQIALRQVLDAYLKRVEWDADMFPVRLYPFPAGAEEEAPKLILINPYIAFGRPVVASRAIQTEVIADRIDAGESVEDLVSDYGLEAREVNQAILYERYVQAA